ncbi:hypothetical protein J6590_039429 [Homalodisca vitripennis]|nr:hypothetical protein J6590_039429 [Homalodisca vitripennis]
MRHGAFHLAQHSLVKESKSESAFESPHVSDKICVHSYPKGSIILLDLSKARLRLVVEMPQGFFLSSVCSSTPCQVGSQAWYCTVCTGTGAGTTYSPGDNSPGLAQSVHHLPDNQLSPWEDNPLNVLKVMFQTEQCTNSVRTPCSVLCFEL